MVEEPCFKCKCCKAWTCRIADLQLAIEQKMLRNK